MEPFSVSRGGGGKVESVLCFPSGAPFPRPVSRGHLQGLLLIVFPARQHSPRHASQFVGDGDHDFVAWCPLDQAVHPLPEACGIVLDPKQHRTSAVYQHAPQIDVAALADAQQLLFPSSGVLSGHDTDPSGEIAPAPKR
jgi:hypothetical protein